jgi:hypothetical protein
LISTGVSTGGTYARAVAAQSGPADDTTRSAQACADWGGTAADGVDWYVALCISEKDTQDGVWVYRATSDGTDHEVTGTVPQENVVIDISHGNASVDASLPNCGTVAVRFTATGSEQSHRSDGRYIRPYLLDSRLGADIGAYQASGSARDANALGDVCGWMNGGLSTDCARTSEDRQYRQYIRARL